MAGTQRGFIYWCLGGAIFWAMEAGINFLKGTVLSYNFQLIVIALSYLILSAAGAFIFWVIIRKLQKLVNGKINSDCFFITTFTFTLTFFYGFLWVNDRNPDLFLSSKSIAIDVLILFLCLIFSAIVYFTFSKFKEIRHLNAAYLAYIVPLSFLVIFVPDFNWQIYRESVWTLEKFLTFKVILSNCLIICGGALFCVLFYRFIMFFVKCLRVEKCARLFSVFSFLVLIIIAVILVLKPGSRGRQAPSQGAINTVEAPNVMIFLMDTLRADHLGVYGYSRQTSPNIDALLGSAVVFENCFTMAPLTQIVIPSLLTSRYVTIKARKQYSFVNSLVRLQEILRRNGYRTGCFVGFNLAFQITGLEKGFDYFFTQYGLFNEFFLPKLYITFKNVINKDENAWEFSFDKMENALWSWLDRNQGNRFFAYVHITDIHAPYRTEGRYKKMFFRGTDKEEQLLGERWRVEQEKFPVERIKDVVDLYDDSIRCVDQNVGKLINKLAQLGVLDKTLLIFIADHGEAFLEHGVSNHGRSLFEEELKVPLLVRYPRLLGGNQRNVNLISLLDIVPTVLDISNIPVNQKVDGRSFLPLMAATEIKAKGAREHIFSGKDTGFNCIRTKRWKLVICDDSKSSFLGTGSLAHKELKELYDLKQDPLEQHNIYSQKYNQQEIMKLEQQLIEHIDMLKNLGQ